MTKGKKGSSKARRHRAQPRKPKAGQPGFDEAVVGSAGTVHHGRKRVNSTAAAYRAAVKMVQSTVAAGGALDPWSSRTTAQRIARGTAYGPSAPPPYWAEIHALEEAKAKAAIAVAAAQIKQKLITGRALTEKERQVASIAGLSVADVVQARKRILKEQLQEKVARGVVLSRAERFSADELKVQYDPKLDEKGRPVKFQPFLSDARKAALKAVLENKVARDVPLTPREEWYAYYLGVLKGDPPPEIALMNPPDFAAQGGAPARRRRAKKRAR